MGYQRNRQPHFTPPFVAERDEKPPLEFAVGPSTTCGLCKKTGVETHRVNGKPGWVINAHSTPENTRTCYGPKEAVLKD